jgi:hypothetical protein
LRKARDCVPAVATICAGSEMPAWPGRNDPALFTEYADFGEIVGQLAGAIGKGRVVAGIASRAVIAAVPVDGSWCAASIGHAVGLDRDGSSEADGNKKETQKQGAKTHGS